MDKNQPLKQVHIDVLRAIRDSDTYSPDRIGKQLGLDPHRAGQIAHIFLYRRGLVDCEWYKPGKHGHQRRISKSTYITQKGIEYLERLSRQEEDGSQEKSDDL